MVRLAGLLLAATVLAGPAQAEGLRVLGGWVRETPPMQRTGVAFLWIENQADEQRWLEMAASPAAGLTEMHGHRLANGVMRMRRQDRLPIAPQSLLRLKPGGYHLMLFDLHAALQAGQQVSLQLDFDADFQLEVRLPVLRIDQEAAHQQLLENVRAEATD